VDIKNVTEIAIESITPQKVGEKAFGLSSLPKAWTLPFIAVSPALFAVYASSDGTGPDELVSPWADQIRAAAVLAGMKEDERIIVRSSGYSEGLKERGKFCSMPGTLKTVSLSLVGCLKQLALDMDSRTCEIALVIQKHADPIRLKGHLSNESRVYKETRDWAGEYEGTDTTFTINLRNWRKRIVVDDQVDTPLQCDLDVRVPEVLKIPAAWAYRQSLRLHFEWVWDGKTVYIVQADQEHESVGENPTKVYIPGGKRSSGFEPRCLIRVTEAHAERYNKIRNVFTYMKLGLPITQLYVLDDQSVIDGLALGKTTSELEADLLELVKGSLVIRMDIATDDLSTRQLLPRTEEVRELEGALAWLKDRSAEFRKHNQSEDLVFIFHNFLPAESSAFAYGAPGERKVQIESLWGLPEGLYYNAHDKYVVDTQMPNGRDLRRDDIDQFVVQKKANYKHFFVAPDQEGHWTTRILKAPYDWRISIRKAEWVKEIALESRRIAEAEGKAVSIMWLVGVSEAFSKQPLFPWYHEPHDPTAASRARTRRTKTVFDRSLVIGTSGDIEVLRQEAERGQSSVRRVRVQPREEKLLREKSTLRVIGELAKKINAVILLEGGVLSHAYYQLMDTDAIVEVLNPFEEYDDKCEFNKLVRDKVPSNIQARGENASKTTLSGESLLLALREKLIEEAFEVLDARDQGSIVGELADVAEVVDGILSMLHVSRDKLRRRQEQKREKAGGFKDGVVLLETKNPLPTQKSTFPNDALFTNSRKAESVLPIGDREVIELGHAIDRWADRREHQAMIEQILHLVVPLVRNSWSDSSLEFATDSALGNVMKIRITGKRSGSKVHIEFSISELKQMKLF